MIQSPLGGGGGGGGAQIRIMGDNLSTLMELADQVEQTIRQVPGVVDVRNAAASSEPEVRAVLNRKRMSETD
ncbi:MAG: hypothetical protein M1358_14120 [Chloroflexi bacterium]|nr:hypothetical protein [Chloroflexota bacterium]